MSTCPAMLFMYEGEYEGECDLPAGHDGPHWDTITSWRTDEHGNQDDDSIDLDEDRALFTRNTMDGFGPAYPGAQP